MLNGNTLKLITLYKEGYKIRQDDEMTQCEITRRTAIRFYGLAVIPLRGRGKNKEIER